MRKTVLTVLLSGALLSSGCVQSSSSLASPSASASAEASAAPTAWPLRIETVRERTSELAQLLAAENWSQLAQEAADTVSFSQVQEDWLGGSFTAAWVCMDEERSAGYADFDSGQRVMMRFDSDLQLTDIALEDIPAAPEVTSTDTYTEQLVQIGKEPQIYGILTIPADDAEAPVVILLPEEFDDPANASGSDETWRAELAHGLAENGVASLRFDMRLYEDPLLIRSSSEYSLKRILTADLAYAVHLLDTLSVDHTDYSLLTFGTTAALGAGLINEHFEAHGGLILMGLPEKDGTALLEQLLGLDLSTEEETALTAEIEEAADETELLYDRPVSYWKEWDELSLSASMASVTAPVLMTYGGLDGDATVWSSYRSTYRSRSRTTLASYSSLTEHLRDSDGVLDADAVQELAYWIQTGVLP